MTSSGVLTLEQVRSADDRPTVDLDVDDWGGRVQVRGMTRAAMLQWVECDDPVESEALILHHGLHEPAVTIEEAREVIRSAPSRPVGRVVVEILRLSGIAAPGADVSGVA